MTADLLIEDLLAEAELEAWFEAELDASDAYQAMLDAKRKAGKLIEAGDRLAAKAVLVLAELEADDLARNRAMQRRAARILAELPTNL